MSKWAMADVFAVGVFIAFMAGNALDNLDAKHGTRLLLLRRLLPGVEPVVPVPVRAGACDESNPRRANTHTLAAIVSVLVILRWYCLYLPGGTGIRRAGRPIAARSA